MGDPKFSRKKYETPIRPWQEERIKERKELITKYGLKNKREVWKAKTQLRKFRREAKKLFPLLRTEDKQAELESQHLLKKLKRLGLLPKRASLRDVMGLSLDDLLARRLQTLTYMKGLTSSVKQARQFIVHGHIAIDGKKVTVPSYLVEKSEEDKIGYYSGSPLTEEGHPMRPTAEE